LTDIGVGDAKSNNGKNDHVISNSDSRKNNVITLDLSESLQHQQIITTFEINKKTRCIIAGLNHVYDKKNYCF